MTAATLLDGQAEKLSQLAYRRFKEALFDGRILAGTTLSQAELVAVTGVPLGPLREALQVLESEGMIRVLPRSGIQIIKPDLALVRNAYQLRRILEVPAVRQVAEAMPRERLEAFAASHQDLLARLPGREMTPEGNDEIASFDRDWHMAVVGFLSNPLLERAYRQAHDHVRLIRLDQLHLLSAAAATRTLHEHLAVIEACLARDPDRAQAALEDHLGRAMQRSLGL